MEGVKEGQTQEILRERGIKGTLYPPYLKPLAEQDTPQFLIAIGHLVISILPKSIGVKNVRGADNQLASSGKQAFEPSQHLHPIFQFQMFYYLQECNEVELLIYPIEGIIIMIKPTVDIHALVHNIGIDLSYPPFHPPIACTHIKDAHAGAKLGLDKPRG